MFDRSAKNDMSDESEDDSLFDRDGETPQDDETSGEFQLEEYDYKPAKFTRTTSKISIKNISSTPEKLRAFSKEVRSPYRSQLKSKRSHELNLLKKIVKKVSIYIQMELCDHTLEDYINDRNAQPSDEKVLTHE